MQVPLSGPDISQREIDLVNQVLSTRYLSIGPMVQRFEELIAAYCGRKHAIAVSSGTSALHLCMRAMDVQPGDRFVTSPYSFVSSANCALFEGARPEFVDIDPLSLNMDVECTAQKLDELKRAGTPARGIIAVQIFGQACDMDPLQDLANAYDLEIIEDSCESIGGEYKGKALGTFGRASCFAFYPNKQMTTGEGGMLVTDDDEWNDLFRSMRNQGRDHAGTWLSHVRLGYNYRMDELSAAIGVGQAERLDELLAKREQVANWYNTALADVDGITLPLIADFTTKMSWFLYVVRLDERYDRDAVMDALGERGVPARPYFQPIHLQPYYMSDLGYRPGDFPVCERISQTTMAIPFCGTLTQEQVGYVAQTLRDVLREQA